MSSDESEEEETEAPSIPSPRVEDVKPEAESSPKVSPRAGEQEVAKVKQDVDEVKQEVPKTKQEEETSSEEDVEVKSGEQKDVKSEVVEKSEDNENITHKGDTQHSDQSTEGTKAKSEDIKVKSEDTSAIENSEVTNKVSEDSAGKVGKYDDFEVPSFSPMEPPPMDDSISDNSGEEKVDDNK